MLSLLLFVIIVHEVTPHTRESLLKEIPYADDLVLLSEITEELRKKFYKWKETLQNKGSKEG